MTAFTRVAVWLVARYWLMRSRHQPTTLPPMAGFPPQLHVGLGDLWDYHYWY
jgi:hypothetical protein